VTFLRSLAVALVLGSAFVSPVRAQAPDGAEFVNAFEKACVPQRESYAGTLANVQSLGWQAVAADANDELREVIALADKAMEDGAEPDWTLDMSAFESVVEGRLYYLVVTHIVAPKIVRLVSCNLYDFDATEAIDPQTVTDLLGVPIERTIRSTGFDTFSWGASPALPGTQGASLTFLTDESKHVKLAGFTGLVLKFDTSEPEPAN
jgi:hypothetical protein